MIRQWTWLHPVYSSQLHTKQHRYQQPFPLCTCLTSRIPQLTRAPSGRDPRLHGKVILHVKQTMMIIHQKNHNNYHVLCIYHCSFVWVCVL